MSCVLTVCPKVSPLTLPEAGSCRGSRELQANCSSAKIPHGPSSACTQKQGHSFPHKVAGGAVVHRGEGEILFVVFQHVGSGVFLAGPWRIHYTATAKAVCSLRCHWHPNKMAPGQGNVYAPGPRGS